MRKILVAEDSFALANLLTFVLKNAGYAVDLHRNGASALEASQKQKYDIILLDQQMPRMTGLEVLEAIRLEGPNRQTPVCLCTAKTHELGLTDLLGRLQISQVFQKPFSPKELVRNLAEVAHPTKLNMEGAL